MERQRRVATFHAVAGELLQQALGIKEHAGAGRPSLKTVRLRVVRGVPGAVDSSVWRPLGRQRGTPQLSQSPQVAELELEAASAYVAPHSGWHCSQVFSSLFCVQVRLGLVMVVEARAGVAVLPSAPGTRHGLAGVRLTSRLAHAARWCTSSTTSQSLAISSWMTSLVGSSSTRLVCTARIAPRPIHAVKSTRTPLLLVLVGPRDLEPPSWRHQSCLWDREIYISARAVPRQQFTSPVQSHNARKTNLLQPLSHNYEIPDALANTVL
jgi:hypothetical protein